MTATAHGWTAERPTHGGVSLITDDGHFGASLVTTPAFDGTQGPAAAADGLVRCIEDAATLAEARRLAAQVIGQRNGNEAECPCCIHSAPTHADGCPLGCLLALLSGDGTP